MSRDILESYKKMFLIRTAEQEIANLYLKDKIMSFVHFYVGQEAVAVGVTDALSEDDRVLGNHRSHGHYLAKGGDLRSMICELLGKANGSSKGKGGSMHMIDKSVNFIGTTPILGSVVPIASGSAFEQKFNNKKGVTISYIGDGASEEGVVYETVNLAALFKLPYVIVIENNLYAVNSKIKDRRSERYNIESIVTGLGGNYLKADGTNYHDVLEKAKKIISEARKGIPGVLECVTHRHMAHSAPIFDDAQGYREEDVLEKRLEMDSVKRMRNYVVENGFSVEDVEKVEAEIKTKVLDDIMYALKSEYPNKDSLFTDVYDR